MAQYPCCTLVPSRFFDAGAPESMLSAISQIDSKDSVGYVEIPRFDAVLVYAGTSLPAMKGLLEAFDGCGEYNKVLASIDGGVLSLVVGRGDELLLANTYPAGDFTTAQYFIFAALKALQINMELSDVCFASPLSEDDKLSLYRYFKSVNNLAL